MSIDPEDLVGRRVAFESAAELITPIVEEHPLDVEVRVGGQVFVPGTIVTAAEQRLSLILDAANWLLKE